MNNNSNFRVKKDYSGKRASQKTAPATNSFEKRLLTKTKVLFKAHWDI